MICIKHFISMLHREAHKGLVSNLKEKVGGIWGYLPSFGNNKKAGPEKITYRVELKNNNDNSFLIHCRSKEALEILQKSVNIHTLLSAVGANEFTLEMTLLGVNVLCNKWKTPYQYDDIVKELKSGQLGVAIDPEEPVNELKLFKLAFYREEKIPIISELFSEAYKRMEKHRVCSFFCSDPPFRNMKDVVEYATLHPGSDASRIVNKYFSHLKPTTIGLGVMGAKLVIS